MQDDDARYRAICANDPRFDGLFFVGISTTGIYCRSVCSARQPRRSSCTFFETAASAERAGYRPCLRCRPELAPTCSPYEERFARAAAVIAQIQAGALNGKGKLEALAERGGISVRQLRRTVKETAGVTPIQLAQTSRLLLAKQLLTETELPITGVAFASGFSSVRRFNELFLKSYSLAPGRFRKRTSEARGEPILKLLITYRPPLAWEALLGFLKLRAIPGVESVDGNGYRRTVSLDGQSGWLQVQPAAKGHRLVVQIPADLSTVLQPLLARVRDLFDLHGRPTVVDEHLAQSRLLAPLVANHPGLRVPGALDGFELAWRAVLGQQVSVAGASTLAGRFAARFGKPIKTPHGDLSIVSPTARRVARSSEEEVAAVGLPRSRARSLVALAELCARDPLLLTPGTPPEKARTQLQALPGIGPWTAEYVVMRALHWPDAFPETDLGLRHALADMGTISHSETTSPWRPWRSYAALHLWTQLGEKS